MTVLAPPRRLLSPTVVRLLAIDFAAMSCFYLLLPVLPLYADGRGIGTAGAGLSTGVLMFVAVGAELAVPGLAARVGYRRLLAAGLVLLGAPAVLVPSIGSLAGLLVVSAVRGVGFAVVVVAIGALVATAVPADRRGEGMGVFGVAAMVPAVLMLPLGVWLVGVAGFATVFAIGAAAGALPALLVIGLPPGGCERSAERSGLLPGPVLRPAVLFAATAVAGGAVVAFLPGAVSPALAAPALLVQSAAATLTRWLAGRYADRHGAAHLLGPAVVVTALGIASLGVVRGPSVLVAATLFGIGFGLAQAASLTTMLQRTTPDRYGAVSAAWNAAYDLGWGVGSVVVGLVVASLGHPAAFAVTGLLVLVALPLAGERSSRRARNRI